MPFSDIVRWQVRRKAHFRCCMCHGVDVQVHHIHPESEGGHNSIENAAPLCPTCHDLYGANPNKRRLIREMRDWWYEICEQRFQSDAEQLHDIKALVTDLPSKEDLRTALHSLNVPGAPHDAAVSSDSAAPTPPGLGLHEVLAYIILGIPSEMAHPSILHLASLFDGCVLGEPPWHVPCRLRVEEYRFRSYTSVQQSFAAVGAAVRKAAQLNGDPQTRLLRAIAREYGPVLGEVVHDLANGKRSMDEAGELASDYCVVGVYERYAMAFRLATMLDQCLPAFQIDPGSTPMLFRDARGLLAFLQATQGLASAGTDQQQAYESIAQAALQFIVEKNLSPIQTSEAEDDSGDIADHGNI